MRSRLGINYSYGKEIFKKYNNLGEKGVKNLKNKKRKQSGGKKPLLTEEQVQKLRKELESRPNDEGIWTGTKVARWIEKETGIKKVWNQRGWDYLKKFGYSWQSPRPQHRKGDKLEQEIFKANLPSKITKFKEKHPEVEIDLWFFDEHRIGLKPIIRKIWSKVGKRPIAVVNHRYEWLYVYGFAVRPRVGVRRKGMLTKTLNQRKEKLYGI